MMSEEKAERTYRKWTAEEDSALRSLVSELGDKRWKIIAERMTQRSPIQCLHRWTKRLMPGIVKGAWSAEEDQLILKWVEERGKNGWARCAKLVSGRSGKQCRERWNHNLDPALRKEGWTAQEDEVLFREYHRVGPKWAHISLLIPGRCDNSVKNRFYSMKRKKEGKSYPMDSVASSSVPARTDIGELMRALISKVATAERVLRDARSLVERRACLHRPPSQA